MKRISIRGVEPAATEIGYRRLSEPLGTTHVAINHYRLAPGEGFPSGLHAHADQEEVFVVVEGEATFETLDGEITVGEGEAIRFAPGEFQSGRNASADDLAAFAIGAPRDSEDVRLPLACPDCGHDTLRLNSGGGGQTLVCPDCGAERVPNACPACGHDDLRVALGEDARPVVVCQGCDAEFDTPPLRD
ncbi:cupin domain-containing protein [Halegenticoccus tardaugens]|uniref:cupin domain-containing protein n=1 Tax=Halegenticoccus tardaugens TaxID=2071624 RepID=UPI00100B64D7|nr:cupin domain-containing protein [Halegenticoccus tardaugens]